ncbi:transmembrane protease serine 9-like isoform X2 [Apostichopus japonicus]|uniref:transmembrane protease serine 9-like isoform X2 n=1 Tax=Stichopus japonicus TaxID=307972 RepID=UPI003AB12644
MLRVVHLIGLISLVFIYGDVSAQMPQCGLAADNPHGIARVVGGDDAQADSWPWMASLRGNGRHVCGATLISRQWAITAAHCVGYFNSIVLGDLLLDTESTFHEEHAIDIFVHPEYNSVSSENDIAILRLKTNATFSDSIQPACLATSTTETSTYSNCWVTGWGDLIEGGGSAPNTLQEAAVDLFTDQECSGFYGGGYYADVMICAGKAAGGVDTCQGDSGGPLVCENSGVWDLLGVTSFGDGCARPNKPGVYSRISSYTDYVSETISKEYIECPGGESIYVKGDDECDIVATCVLDGADEANCPGLVDVLDITSPSYPSQYPNNRDVIMLFQAEDTSVDLRLHFVDFDLESGYDYVSVGSGWDAFEESSILLRESGNEIPADVVSQGYRMWLRFTSDNSITKRGFSAKVSIDGEEGGTEECSEEIPCTGAFEECEIAGSNERTTSACVCIPGYIREDGICIDDNECIHPELNTCNPVTEMCINKNGTFECECKPEYLNGTVCSSGGEGEGEPRPDPNACGTRPAYDTRVVGGTDAEEGAWPWMASLRANRHSCGATLIGTEWAVTAAHCIGYFSEIIFGDLKLNTESAYHQEKSVTIFQHPEYEGSTSNNDIALLLLSSAVDVTDYVRPACLATSQNEVSTYRRCTVSGWGDTTESGSSPNTLQEAEVNLFTDEECLQFYGSDFNPNTMICAGYIEGGIDTCQGDSGGPLVCEDVNGKWHLVGVTSWGDGCARPNRPGVYARVSKYVSYIEQVQNGDYAQCSDGSILLPSQVCDFVIDCLDRSDEAGCALLDEESTLVVKSPNYPDEYLNSQSITWIIGSVSGTRLHLHFDGFDLERGYDFLFIGSGDSLSDESRLHTLTGPRIPDDITIDDNQTWLYFASDDSITKSGFQVQISVLSENASFVCDNGQVIPNSWVCDIIVDCPNTEDETLDCSPLEEGDWFLVSSPGYAFENYPDAFSRTYLYTAEYQLNVRVTFLAFDLEDGYDLLTVGYGSDPNDESTIGHVLTGSDLPEDIVSPLSSLWLMFSTDASVTKTGFLANVTITSKEREPCSEFLEVTTEVQTLERIQTTRGDDCGISLVSSDVRMKIRLVIDNAEIDCNTGEFLVVQRTISARTQTRDTNCGTISNLVIEAADSVTLIEYNLKVLNHYFRISYQSVSDPTPSFRGCHQLHTLSDGPVTFTSPRYPLNYRGNRKCEFRFVASPGKKINLSFDEFILQEDQRCRADFVRITDFVTLDIERYCGVQENLSYNSTSNYVSVLFRTNRRQNFKGFSAEAREFD